MAVSPAHIAAAAASGAAAADTNTIDKALTAPVSLLDRVIEHFSRDHSGLTALVITVGLRIVIAVLILTIGGFLGGWLNHRLRHMHHLDPTLRSFLGRGLKYLIVAVAIITVIGLFGIPMASLLAVMGAAGLAIGLALQGTLSNVAAGVMILILRPFKVGDYIDYASGAGPAQVQSLGLFGSELVTAENIFIYTPNSKIWGGNDIRNYSRNAARRQEVKVALKSDTDIDAAIRAIREALRHDPRFVNDGKTAPEVSIDSVSAASVTLLARFWAKSEDFSPLTGEALRTIRATLEKHGIALA